VAALKCREFFLTSHDHSRVTQVLGGGHMAFGRMNVKLH
jgi:hypothetical protein